MAAPRFACALADHRASERAQGSERSAASGSHCRGSACGGAIPKSQRRALVGLNQRFPKLKRMFRAGKGLGFHFLHIGFNRSLYAVSAVQEVFHKFQPLAG